MTLKEHLQAMLEKLPFVRLGNQYLCWISGDVAREYSGGDLDHPASRHHETIVDFFEAQDLGNDGLSSYIGPVVMDYSPWASNGGRPDEGAYPRYYRFCTVIRIGWLKAAIALQDVAPGTLPALPDKSAIKRMWAQYGEQPPEDKSQREHCTACGDLLAEAQIGMCDSCQDLEAFHPNGKD